MRRALVTGSLAAGLSVLPHTVLGQISPGALSRAHAKLEGSSHCLDCHDPKQGVAPAKCLVCHEPLEKRIAAGKGLHARADHRDCKTCHVEHQGKDASLVWWGKQGRSAFDHSLTGYPLAGKHTQLACEQCHKQPKTFLGAALDCAGCHRDVHRGEFQGRGCGSCHGQTAWRPAPGFDHGRTRWPLSGRHAAIACEKCHRRGPGETTERGQGHRVFRAVAGRDCASCHEDAHGGRLGRDCARCHGTSGWREARTSGFDHGKTAYPLEGRHARVACAACHRPGLPLRLPHARCTDCHRDAHRGELAKRTDGGRCESCHRVEGFRPARFGPSEHARTAFPLRGAHLAVACNACHRRGAAGASSTGAPPMRLAAERCSDCHADPHRGAFGKLAATDRCESCHQVEGWRPAEFDHARTGFRLDGTHSRVACAACHRRRQSEKAAGYRGLERTCAGCHQDPHGGQFVSGGRPTACDRCHTTLHFEDLKFDHARDARFRLAGAHARVACARCHRSEARDGRQIVRYRPLPLQCNGCHASKTSSGGPG